MTRITQEVLVIFLVNGLILLAAGDSTVADIAENKPESLVSTNLSVVDNTSQSTDDSLDFPVFQYGSVKEANDARETNSSSERQSEISTGNENDVDVTRVKKRNETEVKLASFPKNSTDVAEIESSIGTKEAPSEESRQASENKDAIEKPAKMKTDDKLLVNSLEMELSENETEKADVEVNKPSKQSVNSLSNEKQTSASPKSSTQKRSLNSTVDSIDETTDVSNVSAKFLDDLGANANAEFKVDENDFVIVNDSVSDMEHEFANPPHQLKEHSSLQESLKKSVIPEKENERIAYEHRNASNISLELERETNSEEKSSQENLESSEVGPLKIPSADVKVYVSEVNFGDFSTKAHSNVDDMNHWHEGQDGLGVTFDPDGMTHDGPQDPDSEVFVVSTAKAYPKSPEKEMEVEDKPATGKYSEPDSENEGLKFINKSSSIERTGPYEPEKSSENSSELSSPSSETELQNLKFQETIFYHSTAATELSSNKNKMFPTTEYPISDESEEMLGDAPFFSDGKLPVASEQESTSKTPDDLGQKPLLQPISLPESFSLVNHENLQEFSTEHGSVEISSHLTDQSVIRPVKIVSPLNMVTSRLPESFSTDSQIRFQENSISPEKVENSSQDTSSPLILPNPAPMLSEVEINPDATTTVMHQELSDTNKTVATPVESLSNSTIARIAVKTSVSVSRPLLEPNSSEASHIALVGDVTSTNDSLVPGIASEPVKSLDATNSSVSLLSSPESPPSSIPPTTTGVKIRLPMLKIGGGTDEAVTRKPFTPSLRRPSTTAGPPVSIFKKTRTRIASITSSTTARPFPKFSTIRIHYASHLPPGILPEVVISTEPVTTTEPPTTTTEEPISELPFTDQTHLPRVTNEDDVTLVKVAGYMSLDRGIRWNDVLDNRHSPEYKTKAEMMHLHLERLFRSSPIASRLWKIEIDGFSGSKNSRPVGVDFFLYLIKSQVGVEPDNLTMIFHGKLTKNNTFAKFRVDPSETTFEMLQEEPLKPPTPPPEDTDRVEPPIPQWAIAVIVIGAASLIFIVLFATVTMYGRHHMRRRYSSKLTEEDRSSGDWESKMAAAYENIAADTIYDAEDLHSDSYKKSYILD